MVAGANELVLLSGRAAFDAEVDLPPRYDKLRLRLQLAFILNDIIMLSVAGVAATMFRVGTWIDPHNAGVLLGFIALYILVGLNGGAFAADVLPLARKGAFRAVRVMLISASAVIVLAFFLKEGTQISRAAFLIDVMLGGVLLIISRTGLHLWAKWRFGSQLQSEVLIVDGCDYDVPEGAFLLDAARIGLRCDMRDPLMLDRIGRLLAPSDRVVIVCRPESRREWAMVMKGANVRAEIVSAELTTLGPLGTGKFGDGSTVVVATGSLDLQQRMMKRALDISLALLTLLAFAPLLAIVALAIRLDSIGPVLFVQDRVGRGNQLFGIYKFRSMRAAQSDGAGHVSTMRDDDRITRVGRLIRATSIDELPQLFNILKGDMSFVGPRPHALGSLAGDLLFWEVDERYWHRHSCKPGLTGLAQVRGFRGTTHKRADLINRLQADLEYIAGWTLWRDVTILLATLRVVVHPNAY